MEATAGRSVPLCSRRTVGGRSAGAVASLPLILNVGNGGLVAGVQQGVAEPASELPAPVAVETDLETPTSPVALSAGELNLLAPVLLAAPPEQDSSAVPVLSLPVVSSVSALDVTRGLSRGLSLANSPSFIFPASMTNNIAAQLIPAPVLDNPFGPVNLFA